MIWRLDIDTAEKIAIISDPLMRVLDPQKEPVGVNGIKIHGGYLYFSNTNQELLARIPISPTGEPTGPAQLLLHYSAADDFTFIGHAGDDTLVAGNNSLTNIRDGVVSVIADSALLPGSTAVALATRGCGTIKKIYMSTNGGVEQYATWDVTVPGRVVVVSWV